MISLRHFEGQQRIDLVTETGAERIARSVLQEVHVTLATSITIPINTSGIRRITAVTRGPESPLVGLHDIEFRAPVAPDLIGITVLERIVLVIDGGHEHVVKRSDATTSSFA